MKAFSLRLQSSFDNVGLARDEVARICTEHYGAVSSSAINDLSIASTEIMNNAVEHSGAATFEIELAFKNSVVVFSLITEGVEFDPTRNIEMPDLDVDDMPEGGFGIALVRELSDSIAHEYREGKNIFRIEKKMKEEGE